MRELEIRKIPHFEESHSIRVDGAACTNDRYVNTRSGKPRFLARSFLKPGGVSKSMLTLNEAIIDVKKG